MTPEKLADLEAYTEHLDNVRALQEYLKEVASALREAWREIEIRDLRLQAYAERDEARPDLLTQLEEKTDRLWAVEKERNEARADYQRQKAEALDAFAAAREALRERNEARAALRALWEEATDSECCFRTVNSGLDQHHISEPCRAAVKAVLGESP